MLQSSSSEKKLVKPLKNCFFGLDFHRKVVIMGHPHDGKLFFGRNNKSRSSTFTKFLFYQNILCFDWVMNLFLSWEMFSVEKVSFPEPKQLCYILSSLTFLCSFVPFKRFLGSFCWNLSELEYILWGRCFTSTSFTPRLFLLGWLKLNLALLLNQLRLA